MSKSDKKVIVLEPEIDWATIAGSTTNINLDNEIHVIQLRTYFSQTHGFVKIGNGRSVVFHSPKGFRNVFIKFEREKGGKKGTRLTVDFPGSYMYGGDSQSRMNEVWTFANKVWHDLKIQHGPHFSQVDIQIDRLGASFKTHGLCLTSNDYELISTKRKKLSYETTAYHKNPDDPSEQTGQEIFANKLKRIDYNRHHALAQKYNTKEYKDYKKYYDELYQGHDEILRTEIKFKKGLLELFNGQFWRLRSPVKKLMNETLSKYNHLYKIIDLNTGEPVKAEEELFSRGGFTTRKELYAMFGMTPPDGEMRHQDIDKNEEYFMRGAAECALNNPDISSKDFIHFAFQLRKDFARMIDKKIKGLNDVMKSKLLVSPTEKHLEIKEEYSKRINKWIEKRKEYPENLELIKEEFQDALDSIDEKGAFLK